jgi:hypothetical protein
MTTLSNLAAAGIAYPQGQYIVGNFSAFSTGGTGASDAPLLSSEFTLINDSSKGTHAALPTQGAISPNPGDELIICNMSGRPVTIWGSILGQSSFLLDRYLVVSLIYLGNNMWTANIGPVLGNIMYSDGTPYNDRYRAVDPRDGVPLSQFLELLNASN